jgi:hypothetical protein
MVAINASLLKQVPIHLSKPQSHYILTTAEFLLLLSTNYFEAGNNPVLPQRAVKDTHE